MGDSPSNTVSFHKYKKIGKIEGGGRARKYGIWFEACSGNPACEISDKTAPETLFRQILLTTRYA